MASARTLPQPTRRPLRQAPEPHSRPFIWREALWTLDWLSLRFSPVYLGLGVPRGNGAPVVLVPGFLTTDALMVELYLWLQRIGYRPSLSGIGLNADCIQALTAMLERTVEDVHSRTGEPVRIIGHSLGGVLARRVALKRPDIVSQLISLGSPIQSLEAHPLLVALARLVTTRIGHPLRSGDVRHILSGHSPYDCECTADHCTLAPPPSVRRAALYSRWDGVIDWRHCLEPEPQLNYEVGGTHVGMVFNPRAYRLIAHLLADEAA